MRNIRVLLADSNHPILIEVLQSAGFICDAYWDKTPQELIKILPEYQALVIRSKFKISREVIDQCSQLRCIGRVGAGMENIDVSYAESKGVKCLSVPEGNRDAVGEHAVGMLLMLLNKLKKADNEVRNGIWLRAENRGTELGTLTVGIIGYGNMGSAFAQKLRGFGCNVLAYDKYKKEFADSFVEEVSLDELMERVDILSLHVPLTQETNYMVNKDFIHKFKKNIYVINTARGPCIKTKDLVDALKSGKVLGACLDVLEYESFSFEKVDFEKIPEDYSWLLQSDKVILTPHIAGWTHESNYKMSKLIAEKMLAVLC